VKIKILLTLILWIGSLHVFSQNNHYWVYFDKDIHPDVVSVSRAYTDHFGIELIGHSKWFHSACVSAPSLPGTIYPGVIKAEPLGRYQVKRHGTMSSADSVYGHALHQLSMLGIDSFHRLGYRGRGVRIALFDAGFNHADSLEVFDSIHREGRLKAFYDFVDNDSLIFEEDNHGMWVWSVVGGNWPDSLIGAAPDADYLLARTENVHSETHLEEYSWVKAMEWADSVGVDIIHSSLGYTTFDTLEGDYSYEDLDGNTTVITRAAQMAYDKGIFITNSAGNEGDDPWLRISAPCDGENVLCVGSVDSFRNVSKFSGKGPSYDGRVKPDVVAMGQRTSFVVAESRVRQGNGTSFSGPLIAGFVALLKEKWPDMSNDRIFRAVTMSAHKYEDPDTAFGYGIPNIFRADSILQVMLSVEPSDPVQKPLSIYPNPAQSELHVHGHEYLNAIRFLDLQGQEVLLRKDLKSRDITLDINDLPNGMYLLEASLLDGMRHRERVRIIH